MKILRSFLGKILPLFLLLSIPSAQCRAVDLAPREAQVKQEPKNPEARLNLGWGYYENGQKDKAELEFRAATALDPNYSDAYVALASLSKEKNDAKGYESNYRKGLAAAAKKKGSEAAALSDMKSAINYSSYGWLLWDLGQKAKALAMFQAAVKAEPQNPSHYETLASVYSWDNKPEEALKWFKQGLAMLAKAKGSEQAALSDMNTPLNYLQLGRLYLTLKQFDKAEENLKQAARIQPDNINIICSLAEAYQANGNSAKYIAQMKRAMAVAVKQKGSEKAALSDMTQPVNYMSMGWAFQQSRDYDNAIRMMKEAVAIQPDNMNAYMTIAAAYQDQNKLSEGSDWLQKALAFKAKNKGGEKAALADFSTQPNYTSMGEFYLKAKQYAKAAEMFEAAAKIQPDNSAHYKAVSDCYAAQARYDQALEWIKKAITVELKKSKS